MAITLDGTLGITTPDLTDTSLTSGRVVYAGTSGNLTGGADFQFNTNGLGIGAAPNTSPGGAYYNLNVGTQGGGGIISGGTDTYFTNNLYITAGVNYFAYTGGSSYGSYYNQTGGNHTWKSSTAAGTGNSAATLNTLMTLNNNGALALFGGASANGVGITFPATQSASSDANTLDDYEEGNWTPTVAATTTNPTVSSYPTRVGRYVKIGKQVTIYCGIQNNSSGGSGNLKITGLPFQATSDDCTFSGVSALNGDFSWGTSKTGVLFAVGANQSHIDVYATQNGVAQAGIPIGNFNADSKYLNITLTYFV